MNLFLPFFEYDQLPDHLHDVCKPFCDLARYLAQVLPEGPNGRAALCRLLEARDNAILAIDKASIQSADRP